MTTTEVALTDEWVLISTTTALIQAKGTQGCFVYVGGTAPAYNSPAIKLKQYQTYTYTPSTDSLYARSDTNTVQSTCIVIK